METAAVTSILSLLAYLIPWLIEVWDAGQGRRKKEADDADTQAIRQAAADGDVAALNTVLDGVLSDVSVPDQRAQGSDSAAGQHSPADLSRDIQELLKP